MSHRRETRSSRAALFDGYDGLEEGLRASSSQHDNDKAIESLQDRVVFLKRVIYMKKWKVTIAFLIKWETAWMHQGVQCQGLWIVSGRYLRRNLVIRYANWQLILWFSS